MILNKYFVAIKKGYLPVNYKMQATFKLSLKAMHFNSNYYKIVKTGFAQFSDQTLLHVNIQT
jgi:hypothetical protein